MADSICSVLISHSSSVVGKGFLISLTASIAAPSMACINLLSTFLVVISGFSFTIFFVVALSTRISTALSCKLSEVFCANPLHSVCFATKAKPCHLVASVNRQVHHRLSTVPNQHSHTFGFNLQFVRSTHLKLHGINWQPPKGCPLAELPVGDLWSLFNRLSCYRSTVQLCRTPLVTYLVRRR